MKIEIDGENIRVRGEKTGETISLKVHCHSTKSGDLFSLSLCYDGFEHGCLPMIETDLEGNIIVTNNMKSGRYLLNGRNN